MCVRLSVMYAEMMSVRLLIMYALGRVCVKQIGVTANFVAQPSWVLDDASGGVCRLHTSFFVGCVCLQVYYGLMCGHDLVFSVFSLFLFGPQRIEAGDV